MLPKERKALKEALLKRASVLRVPFEIRYQIVTIFCNNVDDSGIEWAITRFKSIKTDFLRFKAGLQIETPWIKKRNNYFLGDLGSLQRWSMKSDKSFAQAIQLLQIYTYFISPDVTEQQAKKFVDAVQSNVVSSYFDHYTNILLFATKEVFPEKSWYSDPDSLLFRSVSDTKSEPHPNGRSYDEGQYTLNCASAFLDRTAIGRELVLKYPALFSAVMSGVACAVHSGSNQTIEMPEHHNVVGKIGLIQEPGFKLRAVANPGRVYQQALKPLGDDLYGKLSKLPWDCTHDQNFPFHIVQEHLSKGGSTHAVDLSNATDMFPFSFQEKMLYSMYHRTDAIQLFADLSRAEWMCDLVPGSLSWSTGQPLGLFPSFASFALAHGLMLYGLNNFRHNNMFFVLGDDVIILDDELNRKYKCFLEDMGIPFSVSKTLSSTQLTEFGGKLITSNSIIPQLKWRQISDDSFIDIARLIGDRIRPILRKRQRDIFDVVKVVPDFLGGCGLNPTGIPLEERVHLYYKLFSDESLQSYLLSYNGRISTIHYAPPFPRKRYTCYETLNSTILQGTWFYPVSPTDTFDQKVISLAKEIPLTSLGFKPREKLSGFPWTQTFGSVLYNAFPRERYMQLEHRAVECTQLEVLERKVMKL